VNGVIAESKESAVQGMELFLRNFSYVPEDRLRYTPTPTSKSALRIAAHAALYAARFARMIRERKLPVVDNLDRWLADMEAEEVALTTRAEIEAVFRQGTNELIAALELLNHEDLELRLDSGQGWTMHMTDLIKLPGWHATLHTGQIDYLQTCWGDQEIYVG
jgi:hypothetical protein